MTFCCDANEDFFDSEESERDLFTCFYFNDQKWDEQLMRGSSNKDSYDIWEGD